MKIYTAICQDRHIDPVVRVFDKLENAINYAKSFAEENANYPKYIEEHSTKGFLYHCTYSCEGDNVVVVENILNRDEYKDENVNTVETKIDNLTVKVKKTLPNATIPTYATDGSACFDIKCIPNHTSPAIKPGEIVKFRTGLSFEIPENYVMRIYPRSGLSLRYPNYLANSVAVIDSDFRGELQILFTNNHDRLIQIYKLGKIGIVQGIIEKYDKVNFKQVESLSKTKRGDGGFGSTGV
jgi:dUTP pyrophosphatase